MMTVCKPFAAEEGALQLTSVIPFL